MRKLNETLSPGRFLRHFMDRARPRTGRTAGARASLLEKRVGGSARCLFRCHGCLEPGDFVLEQSDALTQFLDRKQGEVLADLVRELSLRPLVVVDRGHGRLLKPASP